MTRDQATPYGYDRGVTVYGAAIIHLAVSSRVDTGGVWRMKRPTSIQRVRRARSRVGRRSTWRVEGENCGYGGVGESVAPKSEGTVTRAHVLQIESKFTTDRQAAIDLAVKYYGIDISAVTHDGPVYYSRLVGDGDCNGGRVRIGPDAFERGAAWLASKYSITRYKHDH